MTKYRNSFNKKFFHSFPFFYDIRLIYRIIIPLCGKETDVTRERKKRKKERKRKEDVLKREGFWRRGLQFHNCDAFVSETRIKQHPWNNVTHHWEEDLVSTGKNIALCNNVTSCSFKSAPSSTPPPSSAPLTTAKRRVKAVKQILTDTAPCPLLSSTNLY